MSFYIPGETIGDQFFVLGVQEGGMGRVYFVVDLTYDERSLYAPQYALKTLKPEFLPSDDAKRLFRNELITWIGLGKHPNVVQCIRRDVFDSQEFIRLQFVHPSDGKHVSLRTRLASESFPLLTCIGVAEDVCRALIHCRSIYPELVHRDIKPGNILLDRNGVAKLTDFGLALTRRNVTGVEGTPAYMAPEQWEAGRVDGRTDIYGIGCVLYEMITGEPLFTAATDKEYRKKHRKVPPPNLVCKGVPKALEHIIAKCLAKDPESRFENVQVLLTELERLPGIHPAKADAESRLIELVENGSLTSKINRGDTYFGLGMAGEAISDYSAALEYVFQGRLSDGTWIIGDRSDGVLELCPMVVMSDLYEKRAICKEERGDTLGAIEDFGDAINSCPEGDQTGPFISQTPGGNRDKKALLHYRRGRLLRLIGDTTNALADFARTVDLGLASYGHYEKGLVFYEARQYDHALDEFKQAISADPTGAGPYSEACLTLCHIGQAELAMTYIEKALVLAPNNAQIVVNRGHCLSLLGRYEEAVVDFTKAIEMDPHEVRAWANRGAILFNYERLEAAISDCEAALRLDPLHDDSRFYIASASILLGKAEKAVELYREGILLHGKLFGDIDFCIPRVGGAQTITMRSIEVERLESLISQLVAIAINPLARDKC